MKGNCGAGYQATQNVEPETRQAREIPCQPPRCPHFMANAQFQFQFVYLPFSSPKCGAENVGKRERKRAMRNGERRDGLSSWNVNCQEKAERLGLFFSKIQRSLSREGAKSGIPAKDN